MLNQITNVQYALLKTGTLKFFNSWSQPIDPRSHGYLNLVNYLN